MDSAGLHRAGTEEDLLCSMWCVKELVKDKRGHEFEREHGVVHRKVQGEEKEQGKWLNYMAVSKIRVLLGLNHTYRQAPSPAVDVPIERKFSGFLAELKKIIYLPYRFFAYILGFQILCFLLFLFVCMCVSVFLIVFLKSLFVYFVLFVCLFV